MRSILLKGFGYARLLGSQPNKVRADSPEYKFKHSFLSLTMTSTQLLLALLIIWGIPSTYFRSKFRKIVYQTDDWKINIQPLFKKEILGLFSNMYPENPDYIKIRNQYRIYLLIYLIIFILYQYIKSQS
jgi:hypothetical protein